jgi:signal transduction histidine kinase/DNA-binding response OmpR family regulator
MARDQDKSKEELLLELASLRAELAAFKAVERADQPDKPAGFTSPELDVGQKLDNLPENGLASNQIRNKSLPLILVVEDDPVMNGLLVTLLGRKYQVVSAFEGQEGLEKALALLPDLIMIDIMMPGMSGDQLMVELRHRPVFDEVPLIVLTAKADDHLRLSLLSSNVQAYLNKPFDIEEVQLWVDNLLNQRLHLLEERREREVRLRSNTERKEAEKRQVELLTQIKLAQAEAEAERRHLHRLFMQAPAMIGMHQGPEHIFTFANTLVQELSGNRPLIGKSIREAFSELQGPDFFEAYDRVYNSGQPYIIRETHLMYDRDGDGTLEEGYFDEILQPILKADGSVEGVMFFAFEVTDQVRARQLLQETNELLEGRVIERTQELQVVNEQLLQALEIHQETEEQLWANQELLDSVLNSSPDGIAALDPVRDETGRIVDFKWILANTRAAMLNHLSVEEMVGSQLLKVMPGLARSGLFDRYINVVETGNPFRTEIFYDYEHVRGWFDLTAVKRGPGIALTIREITQQKADQEAIRHLNHILARRAADLERANEELKEFSYSISHDLRAPLRAISGFTQIIDRRYRNNLNEEGQHYLDNIIAASNHMAQLIDDLLVYSRLGREPVDQEAVDLVGIMAEIEENYSRHIETIGATLNLPLEIPLVRGDRTLLSRLFTNLVDNALKYHRPNVPPQLHMGYSVEDGNVIVSMQDNGLGIPAEHYRRIFNLFQRLHSLEEYPGTGLGLAIVKRSVQLMGGDVWLDSTPGQGSIFYIKLPLA